MKDLDRDDAHGIAGGQASTLVSPPGITYPIDPIIQPIAPEQPPFQLIVPEEPLL